MYINVSKLGHSGTGMWQYSLNFIEAVSQLGQLEGIICSKMHRDKFGSYNCKIVTVPDFVASSSRVSKFKPILWLLYSYVLSIYLLCKCRSRILSTTHHALPFIRNQIMTIHDVRPYYHPDSVFQKLYFRLLLPFHIKRCMAIVTVSNQVKETISDLYGCDKGKIYVVYNAIHQDDFIFRSSPASNVILAVGANWKHKNVHTFINAHEAWTHKYILKVICAETEYYNFMKQLVSYHKLGDSVVFMHNMPFDALKEEFASAWCFIYPSIDEGFGIPPIEAACSGTPVIAADIPVFKEILSDAVVYVDPDSYQSWAESIQTLTDHYDVYVQKGLERAAKYNFDFMIANISLLLTGIRL